jgi:HEAT repeat protein
MTRPRRILAALALLGALAGAAWGWSGPSKLSIGSLPEPGWHQALATARNSGEASALREVALAQIAEAGSDAARADAVVMLGYVGQPEDVQLLAGMIDTGSPALRVSAVKALGGIGGDDAVGLLTRIVEAQDALLEAEAWNALAATGHPDALALMDARLQEGRDYDVIAGALARSGSPEAARALISALGDAGPNEIWYVATALASFSHDVPEARKALVKAATGNDAATRAAALGALAQAGDPGVFDIVDHALKSGDTTRLAEVASALGSVQDARALPLLKKLVQSGPSQVATNAVYAIGAIGGPEAEEVLLDLVAHGRPDLGSQAAWALRDPTSPEAVAVLSRAAEDRPLVVRQAAITRLMQGPWGKDDVPDEVLALAREQIQGSGPYGSLPAEAFGLLLDHGDETDAALIREVIDGAPSWQRVTAISALRGHDALWIPDLLIGLVGDPDMSVAQTAVDAALSDPRLHSRLEAKLLVQLEEGPTWAACQGLARLGTPRAIGELFDRIENGTYNEASEAASALASWGDRDAVASLVDLIDDVEDPQVRSTLYSSLMYRTDVDVTELAERALRESDPSIRSMAASALAQSGSPEARAKLAELLDDEDLSVRSSALYALGQMGGSEAEELALGLVDDPELGTTAVSTLAMLGTRSARQKLADVALTAEREDLRAQALYSLAGSPGRDLEDVLERALEDESSSVRLAAISTLQSTGSRRAAEALVPLLDAEQDDPTAWSEAVQAAAALQAVGGPAYKAHQERVTEILGAGYGAYNPWEMYGEGPYPEEGIGAIPDEYGYVEEEEEPVEVSTGDGGTLGRQAELITVGHRTVEELVEDLGGEPLPDEQLELWGEGIPNDEIDDEEWALDDGYEPNASADTGY